MSIPGPLFCELQFLHISHYPRTEKSFPYLFAGPGKEVKVLRYSRHSAIVLSRH